MLHIGSGRYMGVYIHRGALYTKVTQGFICSLVRVVIEENNELQRIDKCHMGHVPPKCWHRIRLNIYGKVYPNKRAKSSRCNRTWNKRMNGDFTNAFAETVGTIWDAKEPTYSDDMDIRAVNYFLYEIMLLNGGD